MHQKHIPIRTCVACRSTGDKRGLLRVVRSSEGIVRFDPTTKAAGRGAYVCASEACINAARKQRKFERSLSKRGGPAVDVPEVVFEELLKSSKTDGSEVV